MPRVHRLVTGAVTLGGLLASAVGIYGVLDATTPAMMGTPTLLAGLALSAWASGSADVMCRGRRTGPTRGVARSG